MLAVVTVPALVLWARRLEDGAFFIFFSPDSLPVEVRAGFFFSVLLAATERELVSTVETLKEHCNMLLGQTIKVFTDHNNPVHEPKCKTLPSSAPHMDVAWSVLA